MCFTFAVHIKATKRHMYSQYVCVCLRPDHIVRTCLTIILTLQWEQETERSRPVYAFKNIAYNGFFTFYIFAWKKSYDFSHYSCYVLCPRAQYTWTSLSTDISTYLSSRFVLSTILIWKVRLIIITQSLSSLQSAMRRTIIISLYILWRSWKSFKKVVKVASCSLHIKPVDRSTI